MMKSIQINDNIIVEYDERNNEFWVTDGWYSYEDIKMINYKLDSFFKDNEKLKKLDDKMDANSMREIYTIVKKENDENFWETIKVVYSIQ